MLHQFPIPVIPFSVNSFIKSVPAWQAAPVIESWHPNKPGFQTSMPAKVQIYNIISPPHCLSLQTIFVLLLNELIKTIKKCPFCWLWKFLTMQCSHSSGSNERQLFSADRYFLDKGSGALAWRQFLTANKQMLRSSSNQSLPYFNDRLWQRSHIWKIRRLFLNSITVLLHKLILIRCHAILLHFGTQQITLGPQSPNAKKLWKYLI